MPRYIFLIASHINDLRRAETLKNALLSISLAKPDHVYLSYSVDENIKKNIDENKWVKALKNIPHNILFQNEKKYQFEHYDILKDHVLDDDIVSFSDDDDLTHENKVNVLKKYFKDNDTGITSHKLYRLSLWYITDDFNIKDCSQDNWREYVCYSMRGAIFKDWFINGEKYMDKPFAELIKISGNVMDLMFLRSLNKMGKIVEIPDRLYYYIHTIDLNKHGLYK